MATKDQIAEVSSWIHDERKCVSTGTILQSMGMSRSEAAGVLRQVVASDGSYQQSTVTVLNDNDGDVSCTVFKMQSGPFSPTSDSNNTHLYAISLVEQDTQPEALSTAHERDMAHLRDRLADNNIHFTDACIDNIHPADDVRRLMDKSAAEAFDSVPDEEEEETTTTTISKPAPSRGPRKVTTAASFFKPKAAKQKKAPKAKAAKDSKTNKPSEEKENQQKTKVGNADDFTGDLEDTDDEKEEENQRRNNNTMDVDEPQVATVPSRKSNAPKRSSKVAVGAMDDFAKTTSEPKDTTKRKRRRKKLVDKTTMDASGYLHTEKQEVWEDIPSDEDEQETSLVAQKLATRPAATVAKKKSSGGKSNMKQGSLMGFFSKK